MATTTLSVAGYSARKSLFRRPFSVSRVAAVTQFVQSFTCEASSRTPTSCSNIHTHSPRLDSPRRGSLCQKSQSSFLTLVVPSSNARWISFMAQRVPIHYNDVALEYTDEVGLPFQRGDFTVDQAWSIFGRGMPVARAEKLLRILHGRRVAGTLDDPLFRPNTASFSAADIRKGLEYLRRLVPVDEITNAGLRAEDELRALANPEPPQEKATTATDDKSVSSKSAESAAKGNPNAGTTMILSRSVQRPKDLVSKSIFEETRARNIAAREAAERAAAEDAIRREAEETGQGRVGGLAKLDNNTKPQTRELSPRMKQYYENAISPLTEVPQMPPLERIRPIATAAFLAVAAMLLVAEAYPSFADQPDMRLLGGYLTESQATLAAIIGLNLAIWLVWKVPPWWRFANRNLLLDVASPRGTQVLLAFWSHQQLWHLTKNMAFLTLVGLPLCADIGRPDFIAVYISCGVLAHLASFTDFVYTGMLAVTTLGASGAVYGVAACYFWLHKFEGFKVFDIPPDPAKGIQGLGFVALMVAMNLGSVVSRKKAALSLVDGMSHLAGIGVGIGCAEYVAWQRRRRRREEEEVVEEVVVEEKEE